MTTDLLDVDEEVVDVSDERLGKLRRFNLVMGFIHLISGGLMVGLGNDFTLPVSSVLIDGPPGTALSEATLHQVATVRLAWATAAFLFLSAFFHFLIASPLGFGRYRSELRRGRNRFRWVEYSLSATLMIVLIALITNITDVAALIVIAVANAAMILFGWVMEMVNRPDRPAWWTPFWFGCIAGIGPWAAVVVNLVVNTNQPGAQGPPSCSASSATHRIHDRLRGRPTVSWVGSVGRTDRGAWRPHDQRVRNQCSPSSRRRREGKSGRTPGGAARLAPCVAVPGPHASADARPGS